jgi:hypothetical protein
MQVQNKLQQAMSRLPQGAEPGRHGHQVGSDFLMIVSMSRATAAPRPPTSATTSASNLVDVISRIDGVGDVQVAGHGLRHAHLAGPRQAAQVRADAVGRDRGAHRAERQVSAGQLGALPAVRASSSTPPSPRAASCRPPNSSATSWCVAARDGASGAPGRRGPRRAGRESYTVRPLLGGKPSAGLGVVLATGANALDGGRTR